MEMDVYKIWFAMVVGAKPINGEEIVQYNIPAQEFYEKRRGLYNYDFFTTKQLQRAISVKLEQAQEIYDIHQKLGIKTLIYTDDDYPYEFRKMPDAPVVLFYKGDASLIDCEKHKIVGVVGARNPDRDGLKICEDICTGLAQNNVIVASGMAQGLDGKAHFTALEAGGKTIAFVGTSLDKTYPIAHKSLQKQIEQNGCVLSEYYVSYPMHSSTFLERNRLIAGVGQAVCVIQAQHRSGSLATANNAINYEKKLFAVPGNITNPMYDGTNKLIQEGAIPLIKAENILSELGVEKICKAKDKKIKLNLSKEEQSIYKAIGRQTKTTNQIFEQTRIPMVRLKALLTKLEMDKIITSQSAGVFYIK